MPDKTALEISDEFRLYIEGLVKRVVLDGKPFDDKEKKWLQRYSSMEGLNYETFEKNLMSFFETIDGLNYHDYKPLERFLKPLSLQAAECFVSKKLVSAIIRHKSEIGEKEEHQAQKNIKLLRDDSSFKHFSNIQKELMAFAYREDFHTTIFLAYKKPLEELLGYINHISDLLQDEDVRQSDEYSQLSSEADSFFKRAQKAQCGEIETIRTEGEKIIRKGENIQNLTEQMKKIKKLAPITIVSTIVDILLWVLYFNWSVDDESFVGILKGLLLVLLLICLLVLFVKWVKFYFAIKDCKKYKDLIGGYNI